MARYEVYDLRNNCHVQYVRWRWVARLLCRRHPEWCWSRLRGWE
ncbi:hypothetical protein [Kribbella sindirgiensis]|nr:hypothetical protein [Kribbella sindirgiensis]